MTSELHSARWRRAALRAAATALVLTGCQAVDPTEPSKPDPDPTSTTATDAAPPPTADAVVRAVPDRQWARMKEAGMWRPGCPATQDGLRRVEVNHYRFDGSLARGVLVVNEDVADTVAAIFTELFDAEFPIRRMRPVEEYDGDANASLADDNTSAYNCRRPDQINAPAMLSPHANGRAIDINPRENPWMDLRCECWFPSARHSARTEGPGKILRGGLVWRLFRERDWIWQNIKVPDYMHFDTGYPSQPYRQP